MGAYSIRRILLLFPTVILAGTLCFFLLRILPGDIVTALNSDGGARPADIEKLREELGFNDPVIVQYGEWLWGALRGDLGYSVYRDMEVEDLLLDKLETTLTMAILAMSVSLLVAIPTGIISAVKRGSRTDELIRIFSGIALAAPPFWVGMIVIWFVSVYIGWSPPIFYEPFYEDPIRNLTLMAFPVLSISLSSAAIISRLMRSMMLEVLYQDYVRTARAKGLMEYNVVIKHAARNAMIPVLTMCGFHFGSILGGVVVVEQVFNLPGLGRMLLLAVIARDVQMILGIVLALTVILSIWILIIDLLYAVVDPRIRYN
jgi:peptide/nickel transport system permease protein